MPVLRYQRTLIVLTITAVVAITTWCWLVAHRNPPPQFDAEKLIEAVGAFCRHQQEEHRPIPPSVSLSELVAGGYLPPEQVQTFGTSNVVITLSSDETNPTGVLMEARFPDGSRCVASTDGSISQLPPNAVLQPGPGTASQRLTTNN
jgi:hypothetical protein